MAGPAWNRIPNFTGLRQGSDKNTPELNTPELHATLPAQALREVVCPSWHCVILAALGLVLTVAGPASADGQPGWFLLVPQVLGGVVDQSAPLDRVAAEASEAQKVAQPSITSGPSGSQNPVAFAQFTASPTSGQAPLTVTFCSSAGIAIEFGDGTSSGMGVAQSGECPTDAFVTTKHTYAAAGTYQLSGSPCPSSAYGNSCGEAARQASSVQITVTPAP
jgi:hypothetical protein